MEILDRVEEFINSSQDLPSLPEVVMELNSMLARNDVNIDKISKLIESDVALTTSILSMANSPLYRGMKEITSIKDGVMRIGIRETKNIIYSSSIFPLFKNLEYISAKDFWKHAIFTAYTAETLSEMIKYDGNKADIYTCGLLHDMGVLILGQYFKDEFVKLLSNTVDAHGNINAGFMDVFDTIHSEVGGLLLKRWELPEKIVQSALYHHMPEQADEKFLKEVKIIKLANEVTIMEGAHYLTNINLESYPFSIRYDSNKVKKIRAKIQEKIDTIQALTSVLA